MTPFRWSLLPKRDATVVRPCLLLGIAALLPNASAAAPPQTQAAGAHSLGGSPPNASRATLTILATPGLQHYTPSSAHYDFGRYSKRPQAPLEYTMTVRNPGPVPLTITRLQTSCHCTRASLEGTAKGRLPYTLKPHQSVPVRVSIRPEPTMAGPQDKMVLVFVQGQAWAAATLELTAILPLRTGPPTP